jgi:hypothetical protein
MIVDILTVLFFVLGFALLFWMKGERRRDVLHYVTKPSGARPTMPADLRAQTSLTKLSRVVRHTEGESGISTAGLQELEELEALGVRLLATARELPPGPDRDNALQLIGRFRVQIATLQSRLRTPLEAGRPITSVATDLKRSDPSSTISDRVGSLRSVAPARMAFPSRVSRPLALAPCRRICSPSVLSA